MLRQQKEDYGTLVSTSIGMKGEIYTETELFNNTM